MKTVKYGYTKKDIVNVGRGFDIMPEKIYENFYHLFRNKIKMKYMMYKRNNLEINDIVYNNKEEQLRERLVAMYESGETTYLDVLLSSRNIVEFISGYYLISKIVQYDNELIKERQKLNF